MTSDALQRAKQRGTPDFIESSMRRPIDLQLANLSDVLSRTYVQ